jgi:hypothetical protein
MRLERSSGRVLKGAPQFLDRAERGATVAADVCLPGVRPSRKSRFSACQGLWKIAGRCASRAAVRRVSSSHAYAKRGRQQRREEEREREQQRSQIDDERQAEHEDVDDDDDGVVRVTDALCV